MDSSNTCRELPDSVPPSLVEIIGEASRMRLTWPDGYRKELPAGALRAACRCAVCTQAQRSGAGVQFSADIRLESVSQFGVAGLQVRFSDGHQRGIFPWSYLRELSRAQ